MDAFLIQGGRPLRGTVRVNGSKNAALPIMAAALLTDEPVTLRDVPQLSDIRNMQRLLASLGMTVTADPDDASRTVTLTTTDRKQTLAHYDIVRTMRAGICVLGPLLAARGVAKVSMPGGCSIGDRPVDLHLRGLRALGADIRLDAGYIIAEAPRNKAGKRRLRGARVFLGGPNGSTVLGTDNVLCAAVLAEGTTIIESAACEPEVEDLCRMLVGMGAKIEGIGSPRLVIHGVESLHGTTHTIVPDRIEAGTYVCAAAMTGGDVMLTNFPTDMLAAFLDRLGEIGIRVEDQPSPVSPGSSGILASGGAEGPSGPLLSIGLRDTVRVIPARRLNPTHIVTQPHPGFPTDLQAQTMALLCLADGNSLITEKIFPDRFLHVAELLRMGADIRKLGANAMVHGIRELIGAPVMASDLRASAGLVIAGLAARGETLVQRVYHLDRGYERMELTLQQLGAEIERVDKDAV